MNRLIIVLFYLAIAVLSAASPALAGQYWIGGTAGGVQDPTLAANWNNNGSPTGQTLFINVNDPATYPIYTGVGQTNPLFVQDLMIGRDDNWNMDHPTGPGQFDQTGGTLNVAGYVLIDQSLAGGVTSYYNMSGGTMNCGETFYIGSDQPTSLGVFNLSNAATVSVQHDIVVGGGGSGVANIGGTASLTANGHISIGDISGGSGQVVMTGGSMTANGGIFVSNYGGGSGSLAMSGNSRVTTTDFQIAWGGTGVVTVGGSPTDTAVLHANQIELAWEDDTHGATGADGTLNLNRGGTIETAFIRSRADSGYPTSSVLNFNGGVLKATANNTTFISNSGNSPTFNLNVLAYGANIDTNGYNVTVTEPFKHDMTDPWTGGMPYMDGGLTKTGAGSLTLNGMNTYNGPTNVQSGMLILGTGTYFFPTGSAAGDFTMANGTTLVTPNASTGLSRNLTLGNTNLVIGTDGTSFGTLSVNTLNGLNTTGNKVVVSFNGTTNLNSLTGTYQMISASALGSNAISFVPAVDGLGKCSVAFAYSGSNVNMTIANLVGTLGWIGDNGNSNWDNAANWQGGVIPNAIGARAWFDDSSSLPAHTTTANLINSDVTVGSMLFDGAGYTISGSKTITLQTDTTNIAANTQLQVLSGSHTISPSIMLTGSDSLFSLASGTTLTLNGSFKSSAGCNLVENGSGTLKLRGNDTNFLGNMVINGDTLLLSPLNGSTNYGLGSPRSVTQGRSITIQSGGTLNIAWDNMYDNGHSSTDCPDIIINSSTLKQSASTHPAINNVVLNGSSMISTTNSGWDAAAWHLNGTLTSTGTSSISASGGSGKITLQSGDITNPNTTFDVQSGTLSVATSATLQDGKNGSSPYAFRKTSLTKTGAGTMTMSGTMAYTGDTNVNGGIFNLNTPAGQVYPGNINVTGGTVNTSAQNGNFTGNIVINAGGTFNANGNSNTNQLGKSHSNAPSRSVTVNAGGTLSIGATDMYTGGHASTDCPDIFVNGGSLTESVGHITVNNVTLAGGTMTGNGASAWGNVAWHLNGTLTSSGNSTINYTATGNHNLGLQNGDMSNPATTFNVVSDTLTVSANIVDGLAGSGSYGPRATTLIKTGAGTMTLTGNDTYTGNTYVNAGTLNATTGINTPSAIVGVADGATLTATSIVADSLSIGGGPYGAPVVNACPVPEPGSLTLLVLAGLGALVAVWRRK